MITKYKTFGDQKSGVYFWLLQRRSAVGTALMVMSRPEGLPDFERPPLDEVVLGIQFADVPFRNYHAGVLWQRFQEYPKVEEQAPVAPAFETFGAAITASEIASIQFVAQPGTLRYWFVSEDESQLLQIQTDRVIHNWRRRHLEHEYPRYENVRERFENELQRVQAFFSEQGWGQIQPNQCEVSYINVIGPSEGATDPVWDLSEIFTFWSEKYSDGNLSHSERGQFSLSFLIRSDAGGEPVGRLHVTAKPVIRRLDSMQALQLSIMARGRPTGESLESALQWLDTGRVAVVKAFTSLTTQKMHKIWGRKK